MADVSDAAIAQAYADVRDDKTETNWFVLCRFSLARAMLISRHSR